MMKKASGTEETRPITVDDHRTQGNANEVRKSNAVNDVLKFPTGDEFEKDLTQILSGDYEEKGEVVVIALLDFDDFDHINKDFGREVGDAVLIATGKYIKEHIPENATIYRIGGDEFALIFKGETEREDVFLFLNELKNGFDVQTPDGAKQTLTIGMATAGMDASRYAELVRKADSALYRAKVNGRNKVAMAREDKMIPKTSHYTQEQLQRLSKLAKAEGIGEAILLREALDMLLKKYDI
jgi:diguanylate cyclase (GGDEF)-like protein